MKSEEKNNKALSLADKLELVLITFKRARNLEQTLAQLQGCPFADCKLTILDNASPDDTPVVVQRYQPHFKNLVYIRHKTNIGGNANILRAAEISTSEYTWIICDDDDFNFSDCEDVIRVILEGKVDLIQVGGHDVLPWPKDLGYQKPADLVRKGFPFFNNSSFVPANIFRSRVFYAYLDGAYQNIRNWYPHMVYCLQLFQQQAPVYISRERLVTANVVDTGLNYNAWLDRWINTSRLVSGQSSQRDVFFDVHFGENRALTLSKITFHFWDRQISLKSLFKTFSLYGLAGYLMLLPYFLFSGLMYPFIKLAKLLK